MRVDPMTTGARVTEVAVIGELAGHAAEAVATLNATGIRSASLGSFNEACDALSIGSPPSLIALAASVRTPSVEAIGALRGIGQLQDTPLLVEVSSRRVLDSVRAFRAGANEVLAMPYEPEEMIARVQNQLRVQRDRNRLHATVRELERHTQSLRNELEETKAGLKAEMLENERISVAVLTALERANWHNDDDRGNHVRRVTACSAFLATLHGCTPEFVGQLRRAAPLHDIGKIALPDRILEHRGRFSDEERALMEQHTIYGVELIEHRLDPAILNVVRSHHEHWDGSGYPDGLKGPAIPLEARIVAVADCYDALLCPQPSRQAYTMGQAISLLEECAGTHLDPDLVELVLLHRDRWAQVWLEAERG